MDLYFITSNKGKAQTLQRSLDVAGCTDIKIIQKNMDLMEPQADTVAEVSRYKAEEAYKILKAPLLVEDGSFCIEALNGFPGVYTKYVLETIGVEGIVKLMQGQTNRQTKFVSCATFVDEKGEISQFFRDDIFYDIATEIKDKTSPYAWSELWKVIYVRENQKLLCDFSKEELDGYYKTTDQRGSLQKFMNWYINGRK